MSLINCPECEKEISEKSKVCPNCGYKLGKRLKKHNAGIKKYLKAILCGIIGFGFLACVIWILCESQWSLNNAYKIISTRSFECLMEHDWIEATCQHEELCNRCGMERGELGEHAWQEATCTNPEICIFCGETRGDVLEHDWMTATCNAPKTCNICKLTEGKEKGHSTRMGYCDRCNVYISELQVQYNFFINWWEDVEPLLEDVAWNLQYASIYSSSTYLFDAIEINREIVDLVYDAQNICGNYTEFSLIKSYLSSFKNNIPIYSNGLTLYDSQVPQYASDIANKMKIAMDYMGKIIDELENMSK